MTWEWEVVTCWRRIDCCAVIFTCCAQPDIQCLSWQELFRSLFCQRALPDRTLHRVLWVATWQSQTADTTLMTDNNYGIKQTDCTSDWQVVLRMRFNCPRPRATIGGCGLKFRCLHIAQRTIDNRFAKIATDYRSKVRSETSSKRQCFPFKATCFAIHG